MDTQKLVYYGIAAVLGITLVSIALRKIKEQNNRGGIIAPTQPKLPNIQSNQNAAPSVDPFARANTANPATSANRYRNSNPNLTQQKADARKIVRIVIIVIFLMNFLPAIIGIFGLMISFLTTKADLDNGKITVDKPSASINTTENDGKLDKARELNEKGELNATVMINYKINEELSETIDIDLILDELTYHGFSEPFTFSQKGDTRIGINLESKDGSYDELFEFVVTEDHVIVLKPDSTSDQVYNGYFTVGKLEKYLRDIAENN